MNVRHLPLLAVAVSLLTLLSCSGGSESFEVGPPSDDAVLNLYRNEHFRPIVLEFYTHLTESAAVAQAILQACDEVAVPPSLAFSLAWNESKFNPNAVHQNVSSVDRGLFQLNSRTFAGLKKSVVFDPVENARIGLRYYKSILEKLKTPEKALGYYNAGIGLLTNRPLPRTTRSYIGRILEDQKSMDSDAIAWLYFSHDPKVALR